MKKIVGFSLMFVSVAFLALSCQNQKKKANSDSIEQKLAVTLDTTSQVVKFENTLFSIPSPYQLSMLVKEIGSDYNESLLNESSQYSNYNSTFKKSLNLGVYGADLAYINTYEQSPLAIKYFSIIKILAQDLGLTAALSSDIFERIENNVSNQDSLLYIISNTYRDVDFYLKESQRQREGALVLAGGWVEAMYMLTSMAEDTKHVSLIRRVGENKQPLESLIKILSPYYDDSADVASLVDALIELSYSYDEIEINYEYKEPITDVENKITIVTSEAEVIVSDAVLAEILTKITQIRDLIIS